MANQRVNVISEEYLRQELTHLEFLTEGMYVCNDPRMAEAYATQALDLESWTTGRDIRAEIDARPCGYND